MQVQSQQHRRPYSAQASEHSEVTGAHAESTSCSEAVSAGASKGTHRCPCALMLASRDPSKETGVCDLDRPGGSEGEVKEGGI